MGIHSAETCEPPCPFHRPSPHHMRKWPIVIRVSGLVERTCEHGCGHPDPDSLAYLMQHGFDATLGVHGCCGCCLPPQSSRP